MLLYADSFDHYGTGATSISNMLRGAWAELASTGNLFVASGISRTGNNALRLDAINFTARLSLKKNILIAGTGFGYYMANLPPAAASYFAFRTQSNVDIIRIYPNSDGALFVTNGAGTSTLGITDSVLTPGTFHHIEFKVAVDSLVGEFELRVNGIVVLKLDNLNLGSSPAAQWIHYRNANNQPNSYIDDLFIWDDSGDYCNDFLGPQRILTLFPATDTPQADWTVVGAASGAAAIGNAVPDGDTSYIGTDTEGDISEFTLPTLPSELASIAGVFIHTLARSDEAGVSNMRVSMVSDSDVLAGDENILTPAYNYSRDRFEYDPATDQPWTKSGFEAAKIRVEKTL